jgi:hypothetical protein
MPERIEPEDMKELSDRFGFSRFQLLSLFLNNNTSCFQTAESSRQKTAHILIGQSSTTV